MDEEVELRHAWVWDCPECGRENLDRGPAMNEEDRTRYLQENEMLPHTVLYHARVACKFCDKMFKVADDPH